MEYSHGGDIYRFSQQEIIDFSANINPLGMPEAAIENAKKSFERAVFYPDYRGEELCKLLGKSEQIDNSYIILGNGAAELIYAIAYGIRPKRALIPSPTFLEYETSLKNVGCEVEYYPINHKNFCIRPEILLYIRSDIDIVYLCNPNNPTGQLIDKSLLLEIIDKCRLEDVYLVIDECFLPFLENEAKLSMRFDLEKYDKLIIIRAFTKIYAMPGLRLGYLLSSNCKLLDKIRCQMQPWNTSTVAQAAGVGALQDKNYLTDTYKLLEKEKEYLFRELSKIFSNNVYKPSVNFIFFKGDIDLKEKLLDKGIIIRDCSNFSGLEKGYYRVAVRTHAENEKLIDSIKKCNNFESFTAK